MAVNAYDRQPPEVDELLARAFARFRRSEVRDAVNDFARAADMAPTNAGAWIGLAASKVAAGDPVDALPAVEQARRLSPDDGRLCSLHGLCLTKHGRFDEAKSAFDEAIELAPDDPASYLNAAVVLNDMDMRDEALEVLDQAVAAGVHDRRIWRLKGFVHMQFDDAGAAAEAFDQASALGDGDRSTLEARVWALRRLGRADDAAAVLRAGMRGDERKSDLITLDGWLRHDSEDYAGALKCFKAALARDKHDATALHGQVACLRLSRQFAAAEHAVRLALRRVPDDPALLNERAWLCLDQGRLDDAMAAFDAVLARDAGNEFALLGKARSLRLLGRYDEARDALAAVPRHRRSTARHHAEQALLGLARYDAGGAGRGALRDAARSFEAWLQHEPDDPIAHAGLGMAQWGLGHRRKAIGSLDQALAAGPDHPRALDIRLWLGDVCLELGDLKRARAEYEQGLAIDPTAARAHFRLAQLLVRSGDRAEAIDRFTRAAEGDDPYAHLWLAGYFAQEGRYDVAREHWASARGALERSRNGGAMLTPDDYYQLGCVLFYVDGELDEAERVLLEGVDVARASNADEGDLWTVLACVYLESAAVQAAGRPGSDRQRAADAAERAARALRVRVQKGHAESLVRLAELHLALEAHAEARACLDEALTHRPVPAGALSALATLHTRAGHDAKAVQCLSDAVREDGDDLTLRSRFAGALFHGRRTAEAEREYRRVLSVCPQHIESLVGLGELYSALGDEREDQEYFEQAVDRFSAAVNLVRSCEGSKRLTAPELADVLYARGYARVRLFETASGGQHDDQLRKAGNDFRHCARLDGAQHMARRADDKIQRRLKRQASQAFAERIGPILVAGLALIVFALTQASMVAQRPMSSVDGSMYATLSFGALLFVVAGLCLPRLLRLKIAGMELEQSSLERAPVPKPLGVHVQALRPPTPHRAVTILSHRAALKRVEPALAPWMSRAPQTRTPELLLPEPASP
jgi:tetratricopeptide (TPR) repeat protein